MNTPFSIQILETNHNGYPDWPVHVIRDARNIALAEVGHIDRASAEHVPALSKLFAAAPELLAALHEIAACEPRAAFGRMAQIARAAIAKATL